MLKSTLRRLKLPWATLEAGQGFFIPCLDFRKVRMYVMDRAMESGVNAVCVPGIKGGAIGLLFYRKMTWRERSAQRELLESVDPFDPETDSDSQ